MGSAPNVAATADTTHPVKQGLIQALGVFTDTLVICSCTAFIILIGGVSDASVDGIQLTQTALTAQIGPVGEIFIALTILMFAFSSVIGNYYYGEANIRFITKKKWVLNCYRILVAGMVLCGALITLDLAWALADLTMALMALCNLIAIMILSPQSEESRHQEPRIQKRKLARNSGQARMLVNRYVSPGGYSAADFRRSAFSAMVSWSMTSWMSPSMKTGRLYIV